MRQNMKIARRDSFTYDTPIKVSVTASRVDSDLEAFSHNPADDSFAALSFQATALPII